MSLVACPCLALSDLHLLLLLAAPGLTSLQGADDLITLPPAASTSNDGPQAWAGVGSGGVLQGSAGGCAVPPVSPQPSCLAVATEGPSRTGPRSPTAKAVAGPDPAGHALSPSGAAVSSMLRQVAGRLAQLDSWTMASGSTASTSTSSTYGGGSNLANNGSRQQQQCQQQDGASVPVTWIRLDFQCGAGSSVGHGHGCDVDTLEAVMWALQPLSRRRLRAVTLQGLPLITPGVMVTLAVALGGLGGPPASAPAAPTPPSSSPPPPPLAPPPPPPPPIQAPRVRRLALKQVGHMTVDVLQAAAQCFPDLCELSLSRCEGATSADLEAFSLQHPVINLHCS